MHYFSVSKRFFLIIGVCLVLVLSPIPLNYAHAQFGWFDNIIAPLSSWPEALGKIFFNTVVNVGGSLVFIILSLIIGFIAFIVGSIAGIAQGIFMWSISALGEVPIIGAGIVSGVGWKITRDLVNMLFVLIMAFIGLATILRLENYQYKKILPGLLIIALLVNFSLVLVGFVVDMGNIVTKFFLDGAKKAGVGGVFETVVQVGDYYKGLFDLVVKNLGGNIKEGFPMAQFFGYFIYGITLIFYFLFGAFILSIIALLFFFRVIALWLLAILAPLAFFAYILPNLRQYWDMWLKQLVQWSFIGAIMGFFLYLAAMISKPGNMTLAFSKDLIKTTSYKGEDIFLNMADPLTGNLSFPDLLEKMMTPMVGLIFMGIGVLAAIQFAPAGAQQVIDFGKKGAMTAGGAFAKRATPWLRQRIPAPVSKWAQRLSATKRWGEGEFGKEFKIGGRTIATSGQIKRAVSSLPMFAVKKAAGGVSSALMGAEQQDAATGEKEATGRDVQGNMTALRQAKSEAERVGIFSAMYAKGQIGDAMNPDKVGKGNELSEREVVDIHRRTLYLGKEDVAKEIESSMLSKTKQEEWETDKEFDLKFQKTIEPFAENRHAATKDLDAKEMADKNTGLTGKEKEKGYKSLVDRIVDDAKSADKIEKLQKGFWNNPEFTEAIHKFWGGPQIETGARKFGREFVDKYEETGKNKDAEWYSEIETDEKGKRITGKPRNIPALLYRTTTAARALGIGPAKGAETVNKAERLVAEARIYQRYPSVAGLSEAEKELERDQKTGMDTPGLQQKITELRGQIQGNPEQKAAWEELQKIKEKGFLAEQKNILAKEKLEREIKKAEEKRKKREPPAEVG